MAGAKKPRRPSLLGALPTLYDAAVSPPKLGLPSVRISVMYKSIPAPGASAFGAQFSSLPGVSNYNEASVDPAIVALLERTCVVLSADIGLALFRFADGASEVASFGQTASDWLLDRAPPVPTRAGRHGPEPRLTSLDGNTRVAVSMVGLDDTDIELVFGRLSHEHPMALADLRRLRPLVPWIEDGLRLLLRARHLAELAEVYERAFHLAANELMIVRGGCEVVAISAAARARLGVADGLSVAGGKVSATELKSDIRFRTVISHCCLANSGDLSPAKVQVVTAERRAKRPLILAVTPLGVPATDNGGCALVQIVDPQLALAEDIGIACAVNGLSGAEARVARLLMGGYSLTEAAAELRIQPDTARTYLKQIFTKTGVNRQAALVKLLMASTVNAAPGYVLDLN